MIIVMVIVVVALVAGLMATIIAVVIEEGLRYMITNVIKKGQPGFIYL